VRRDDCVDEEQEMNDRFATAWWPHPTMGACTRASAGHTPTSGAAVYAGQRPPRLPEPRRRLSLQGPATRSGLVGHVALSMAAWTNSPERCSRAANCAAKLMVATAPLDATRLKAQGQAARRPCPWSLPGVRRDPPGPPAAAPPVVEAHRWPQPWQERRPRPRVGTGACLQDKGMRGRRS
jgi:hypothetical protein